MRKVMLFLVMVVLMFGLVSAADRTLHNVIGIDIPSGVVAGSDFEANFSFDYFYGGNNKEGSPLIIRLNVTSGDNAYPVWKGDFVVSGYVEKSFFGIWIKTIDFNCSEEYSQTIIHPLDAQDVTAPDGTFYCYNADGDLALNEHDNVFLNIRSHERLYPGDYEFSAEMFYLTDERAPFVNITNKDLFLGKYYRESDNVLVLATIEDGSGIAQKWSSVTINGVEVFPVNYDHIDGGEYYFTRNTPVDIAENDYTLFVFAEDDYGNVGNDSVVLKVDRTGPVIELLTKDIGVVGENFDFEVNVMDEKSGLNESSVVYRFKELGCPDSGVGVNGSCYNSGWVDMSKTSGDIYSATVDLNGIDEDKSGVYWLEVEAKDVLGNLGILEK